MIPELYTWITKEVGGYFKRYRGGPMTPWIHGVENTSEMDLEARAALAFYEVCYHLHFFVSTARTTLTGRQEFIFGSGCSKLWSNRISHPSAYP